MNEKFQKDFNKALEIIESKRNISLIEQVADNFNKGPESQDNFFLFQMQLLSLIGQDYSPVIIHFFKTNETITPDKKLRTIYATLKKIRFFIGNKINVIEQSIANPFKLSGHMFSYNEELPYHLTSTLTRTDGESIRFLMTMNDGLLLSLSLLENLNQKFNKGSNTIDRNIFDEFKNKVREFEKNIEMLIAEENITLTNEEVKYD